MLPAPPLPSTVPSRSPNFLAPSPSVVTNTDDWQRQFFQPGVSQSRILPLPVKSNPQNNAVASNVAKNVVAPVQAQVSQIQQAVLELQEISFQGAWQSNVSYSHGAGVDYLGSVFVSLIQNNIGNVPTTSPLAWAPAGQVGVVRRGLEQYRKLHFGSDGQHRKRRTVHGVAEQYRRESRQYFRILAVAVELQCLLRKLEQFRFLSSGRRSHVQRRILGGDFCEHQSNAVHNVKLLGAVGTAAALIGSWTSGVSYVKNNQVQFDSNLYACIQGNTASSGNAPPNNQYWQLLGSSVVQLAGKQALYNGNFETNAGGFPQNSLILAAASGAYVVDGWSTNISAIGSVYLDNVNPHSGNLDLVIQPISSSQNLPSDNTYRGTLVVSQPIPVSSGEALQISGWIALGTQGSLTFPSGVTFIGRIFLNFLDQNGNAIGQAYPFADQTALTSYVYSQLSGEVTVASTYGSGKPSAMQIVCAGYIKNNSGSTFSTTSSNGLNVYFDDLQVVPVTTLGTDTNEGASDFFATASVLSYRPTGNPISAVDAGSSATINIAAWTLQTSSHGAINYNSGSITGLSYGTKYWVTISDPQLLGGSVAYTATTSKASALSGGSGQLFVGSVVTPISGGAETFGAGDGGVGTQGGATTLFLGSSTTTASTGSGTSRLPKRNRRQYDDVCDRDGRNHQPVNCNTNC